MKNGYIGKDENNKLRRMRRKSRIYWEEMRIIYIEKKEKNIFKRTRRIYWEEIIRINWEKREEYI